MDRLTEIKDKFKDLGVLNGADVTWLMMKIKDLETQLSKPKSFVVYVNETHEEEKALYDTHINEVILNGDYYHDKINHVINGYLLAMGVDDEKVEVIHINADHYLFNKLEFYDGSND